MRQFTDACGRILFLAVLTLVLLLMLAPLCLTMLLSFDARDYLGPLPPTALSFRWYRELLHSDLYVPAFLWSLGVAAMAVGISTVAGVMAALFLQQNRFRGRDTLLALLLAPFLLPNVVAGFALLLAFSAYGIRSAPVRLVAAHVLLTLPFVLRTTLVGLEGLRPSLREAAMALGAGPFATFREVTFPLVRPGIVAGAVFATAASLGESGASVFLTDTRVTTLPVALLSEMRSNFDLTIAAASGAVVVFTVILVILLDTTIGLERLTGRGVYSKR